MIKIRKTAALAFTFFMLVVALLIFGQTQQPQRALKGEIFRGKIEREDTTGLLLNITPCAYPRSSARVVFFQVPYRTKALQRTNCTGSIEQYVVTEVEQR